MNQKTFSAVGSLLLALAMTACSGGGGQDISQTDDSQRPIDQPRFTFNVKNQPLKNAEIEEAGWNKLFDCEKASTKERLDKEKYSISYEYIQRSKGWVTTDDNDVQNYFIDAPVSSIVSRHGYKTEDAGVNYQKSFSQLQVKFGDESFLPQGPYTYRDSCTDGDCPQESRKFTEKSPMYALNANSGYTKALVRFMMGNSSAVACRFVRPDEEKKPDTLVEEGEVEMSGQTFKAVRRTVITQGEMICSSGFGGDQSTFNVGKATQTNVRVVLADRFPRVSKVSGSMGQTCSSTGIFKSSTVRLNGGENISYGDSSEIAEINLQGEVARLEGWEDKQDAISTRLAQLEDNISDAKIRLAEAETEEATKRGTKEDLERQVAEQTAKATESEVRNDIGPFNGGAPAEYDKRVQDELEKRKSKLEATQKSSEHAARIHGISVEAVEKARRQVRQAEDALDLFKKKSDRDNP